MAHKGSSQFYNGIQGIYSILFKVAFEVNGEPELCLWRQSCRTCLLWLIVLSSLNISTCERADSSVVSAGGGQPAHRGSTPVGSNPGVARGYFPRGVLGLLWCECGCVCLCKPWQACPRTSRQPICVERAVSVGVQLSSYMIFQCS